MAIAARKCQEKSHLFFVPTRYATFLFSRICYIYEYAEAVRSPCCYEKSFYGKKCSHKSRTVNKTDKIT